MCDLGEEEFAEYLRWRERIEVRAEANVPIPRSRAAVRLQSRELADPVPLEA